MRHGSFARLACVLCVTFGFIALAPGQEAAPKKAWKYERQEFAIPMRDGIKLHTVIVRPVNATEPLPFLMQRTPYSADRAQSNVNSSYKDLADDGYIFVFQDMRGRYRSEGEFALNHPPRDRADPRATDDGSDAYDTVAWLLANVPNNNGRAGMLGISYPGWLVVMAMLDPHPALKAVSPQASPADMFMGDDFHHNGAFRLSYGFEYVAMMETGKTNQLFSFDRKDTFEWYLRLGALGHANERYFKGTRKTWNDFVEHPNYDAYWKKQALPRYLNEVKVPALHVAGWWDQEDFIGPLKIYETLEKHDTSNQNFLCIGPWNHGGWGAGEGKKLGEIDFKSPTASYFRKEVQAPWFAYHLKGQGKPNMPEALLFQTGSNTWRRYDCWPPCGNVDVRKLYLQPDSKLAFAPPAKSEADFDKFLSDPARPVPYRRRPIEPTYQGPGWNVWQVEDQRFVHMRPDVLSYETPVLQEDVVVEGDIVAHLMASTSGTDSDWIVKLIDVYPETSNAKDQEARRMAGFQLMVACEVMRGRFLKSVEKPEALVPGQVYDFPVGLHWANHCFKKGHKIMVQVQSTWFPVIDRNPQKFVDNIYKAKDSDYQEATQKVYRDPEHASYIVLPGPAK